MDHLPPPRHRPRLAALLFEACVDFRAAAEGLRCSRETVRLICLPFDDPRRRVPNRALMARIVEWTRGEAQPADFYPQRSIAA